MKDEQDNKDDLIVEIDDSQLALPMENKGDVIVETKAEEKPEVKSEAEQKRERKRPNEDVIKALQAQLDEATRRTQELDQARAAAEQRAREREAELETARGRVAQSEYDRVQGYLTAAKASEASLKREIRAASEMGEHEKIADLQVQLASVAARKLQYEDSKREMEVNAERTPKPERSAEVERPTQRPADTFETRISSLSPASQTWLRQHPECVTDETTNAKVLWAHRDAVKHGIRVDSDQYFEHLENLMGYASDDGDDDVQVTTPAERRSSMPAAPPSRDARSGQVAPGKYRITREEAEMAEAMGITPAKYIHNKLEMQKNGLWRD